MVKHVDYFISAVNYDFEHKRILNVKRHLAKGDFIARGNIINRKIIETDLKNGLTYNTIYRDKNNKWVVDKDVLFDSKNDIITVDPSLGKMDNLGNLPAF